MGKPKTVPVSVTVTVESYDVVVAVVVLMTDVPAVKTHVVAVDVVSQMVASTRSKS